MRLIIGGYAQGKLAYALRLTGADAGQIIYGEGCPLHTAQTGLVLDGLHHLVRRCLQAGVEPLILLEGLIAQNPELVLTAQEVGCGIVPMEPEEREWRESCGRICCELAARAVQVDRVVCGIPTCIKP